MMRTTVVYMAVQVVKRDDHGTLLEWYDGDMRGSLTEANEDAKSLAEQFPDTPYQVIERRVTEIGATKIGRIQVGAAS